MSMRKYLGLVTAAILVGCSADVCTEAMNSGLQSDLENAVGSKVYFKFDCPRPGHKGLETANCQLVGKQAEWLKRHNGVNLRLDGHCDERGPEDYNLALGERRADAVKSALAMYGVDPNRVETRSFGKGNPPVPSGSVPGMTEDERHARNRVVVVNVVSNEAATCSE